MCILINRIIHKRSIYLTKERWSHIRKNHPNVTDQEDIEETIKNPLKTIEAEGNIAICYKHFNHRKEPAKYLKVIVKYLNGEGYVITSYYVKNIL